MSDIPLGGPILLELWLRGMIVDGMDPHRAVAARMFDKALDAVTNHERQRAKYALYRYLYDGAPASVFDVPMPKPIGFGLYIGWGGPSWRTSGEYYDQMLREERLRYEPRNRRVAAHCWAARGYRRWGRWDDILYWWDLDEVPFYRKFGVTKETVREAIHWALSDVALIAEIYTETRDR